jgi:phage tail-like protein
MATAATATAATATPLAAFHFTVAFGGTPQKPTSSFQEVGGIGAEMTTEALPEGGENRYVLQLPKGTKNTNLTLKRGVAEVGSELVAWCKAVMEGGLGTAIVPKTVLVHLLGGEGQIACTWSFDRAYPVKWSVAGFNAMRNELAIESIELAYASSTRTL